jgi:hypothetical protein
LIPLPVETRWNYEVSTIRCFLRISQDEMSSILDKCKLEHLKLTKNEYKKAAALRDILEPLEVLNEKLQGEYFCTISMVAPAIFELEAHLDFCINDSSLVRNSGSKI